MGIILRVKPAQNNLESLFLVSLIILETFSTLEFPEFPVSILTGQDLCIPGHCYRAQAGHREGSVLDSSSRTDGHAH